jgi:iron-sulfur cluster assembly protein
MISLTESAVRHLQELVSAPEAAGKGLRLYVEQGGCAGMRYGMALDHVQEGDEVVEEGGVQVLIDAESLAYLRGVKLDYCDDLTGTGFRLQNPNAVRSCGCGTSFEAAPEAATGSAS